MLQLMKPEQNSTVARIAELNDALRNGDSDQGFIMVSGELQQSREAIPEVLRLVREFDNFNSDNDPYGERDFGSVVYEGETYFFKICYHDRTDMDYGSEDPADPERTLRVMTVMHNSDY